MEIEAIGPRIGELRREDVRAGLGDAFYFSEDVVNVFVLGRAGEASSACAVTLCWSSAGRGQHRMLRCPLCRGAKRLLFTDGAGGLGCSKCLKRLTRHQRDKHRREYRRLGGRQEDQLLRLIGKPTRTTPAALEQARRLADQLADGDVGRLNEVLALASVIFNAERTK